MTKLSRTQKKDFFISFFFTLLFTSILGGLAGFFLSNNKSLSALFTVFPSKTITLIIILYFFRNKQKVDRKREIALYLNQLYKFLFVFAIISLIIFIILNEGNLCITGTPI